MPPLAQRLTLGLLYLATVTLHAEPADTPLPEGVRAVWTLDRAWRERTPTRERICLNGLWQWQPATSTTNVPPTEAWGFFKVPGPWPGITDYMQKDCQTVFPHSAWREVKLRELNAAWYQRTITVPAEWTGRRIVLAAEYLNSCARVYVDGRLAGEMRFPAGTVDLTSFCQPGRQHTLAMLVTALPLQAVLLSFGDTADTAAAREVKGTVARRGLCGDVCLSAEPAGARLTDLRVTPSVRRWDITFDVALEAVAADSPYLLRIEVLDGQRVVRTFTSPVFRGSELREGRWAFTERWQPERLWDLHTPQNQYRLQVALLDAGGRLLDAALPVPFGFRELWIEGRDFYLNGSRIFLSAVPLDNAQVGAFWATYDTARESLSRLQSFGINMVYTHNYGCQPGSHLGFTEILRAADDVGMLVALSQPHFGHYDWHEPDADQSNGYAQHAAFYVQVAGTHPAVVFYAMSHNATGYSEDMNPDMLDGQQDGRDTWAQNNARLARRAEAIVRRLDPSRIVYHHSSGNLGAMHTSNFYPNFAPIQELSDWLETWATRGTKPLFTCEYGAPFTWDWTMYRGWYKGQRAFGNARVPWEFCFAEWNAQFLGDRAFRISAPEKENLRWEARQFRAGRVWHRWDYPYEIGSRVFDDRYEVFARYLTDNWRAFRTWGLSASSPWEFGHFWKLRDGVARHQRQALPVDWDNLQRPGFSADYVAERYERMDLAYERDDWLPSAAARALLRNNRPLLAYIGGPTAAFTSKDHLFWPGETVDKQAIVINNSRRTVTADCAWSVRLPAPVSGQTNVSVPTGEQIRVPLRFVLPETIPPGAYELNLSVRFQPDELQEDTFTLHVPAPLPRRRPSAAKVAIFDPPGQTTALFSRLGIPFQALTSPTEPAACDLLVIGKNALTVDGPGPELARVRDGLKVLVFEQTAPVLEQRLGFRVTEYGLREVFPRVAGHPVLAGLTSDHLRDWRGEGTLVPPRLAYEMRPRYGPTIKWCGIPVTRVWRCGCRGNVASVLIEKPTCGDFLPIVDGGYSLQYSPLLEYREGRGAVWFCQLDVTGRTQPDPAAECIVVNLLQYAATWKPSPVRHGLYVGPAEGHLHFQNAGFALDTWDDRRLTASDVLVVAPGGGRTLNPRAEMVKSWLASGGRLLVIGLAADEANAFLPHTVRTENGEHIAAYFEPFSRDSPFAGIGPADVHNRDPRSLPLLTEGAEVVGNGVLASSRDGVIFCQLAPWTFDYRTAYTIKRTYRRVAFTATRLLANLGVPATTPLLGRFVTPANPSEARWLSGLYLDPPEELDDPYRFFRW